MMTMQFPYQQVVVVGGTGMTGHCFLQHLLDGFNGSVTGRKFHAVASGTKIIGTSRDAANDRPAGSLAQTVMPDVQRWGDRVSWSKLNLEDSTEAVKAQLDAIGRFLDPKKSTAVIVAAAYTNVEGCETDPKLCERINGTNTREVLAWAREFGAMTAFLSTDYVFDGAAGPYSESEPRKAISVYGQSKVDIEEWLEANAPASSLIVRTTGVYDYLPGSKNFLMQVIEASAQQRTMRVPADQWANPVWAVELALATLELLQKRQTGIYNAAGGCVLPRVDFARLIANVFGFSDNFIQPVITKDLGQKAARPLKGGLVCDKLRNTLGWAPRDPETVLGILKWKHNS